MRERSPNLDVDLRRLFGIVCRKRQIERWLVRRVHDPVHDGIVGNIELQPVVRAQLRHCTGFEP